MHLPSRLFRRITAILMLSILFTSASVSAAPRIINCSNVKKLYTLRKPRIRSSNSPQDSFAQGKYLFKFWNPGTMQVYNYATGKVIREYNVKGYHCSTASSAVECGSFCLSTNLTPPVVQMYKMGASWNPTTYTSLQFPDKKYGYFMKHVVSANGKYLYGIANKQKNRRSAANNSMIITVWNLSKKTKNKNQTYSLKLARAPFLIPFIMFVQGMCQYNGKLYLLSSDYVKPNTKVFVVDLNRKAVTQVYQGFPRCIQNYEMEGIFVHNGWLHIDSGTAIYKVAKVS